MFYLMVGSSSLLMGQQTALLEKYLDYRDRFHDQFIVNHASMPHQPAGYGIPAATLQFTDCLTDWEITGSSCMGAEAGNRKLHWADGTYVMGDYLAVLGTEYGLLRQYQAQEEAAETALLILQALLTIERLEKRGNELSNQPGEPPKGWFVRDDVPGHLHSQWDDVSCIASTGSCGTPHPLNGYFTSQDQVAGLLYGLAMIRRFVPDHIEIQGYNIRQLTSATAHRLITYLSGNNWQLYSPDSIQVPDQYGGNAFWLSWGFSSAASYITDSVYLSIPDDAVPFWLFNNMPVLDPMSGEPDSICILSFCFAIQGKDYNNAMIMKLAAAGNQRNDTTMSVQAQQYGHWIYPLARAVIHNTVVPDFEYDTFLQLLEDAPAGGPCYNTSPDPTWDCDAPVGWWSSDRWARTAHAYGLDSNQRRGMFNGLDYMLAYNLYHLYFTPGEPYFGTPVSTAEHQAGLIEWFVYPNPARDQIHVRFPENTYGAFSYSLSGMEGRVLMQGIIEQGRPLIIKTLPEGKYMLCIHKADGEPHQCKVIIKASDDG